jgi:hypothetical protein
VNNELEKIRSWPSLGNFLIFRCRVGDKIRKPQILPCCHDIITKYLSSRSQKLEKVAISENASDTDTINSFNLLGDYGGSTTSCGTSRKVAGSIPVGVTGIFH